MEVKHEYITDPAKSTNVNTERENKSIMHVTFVRILKMSRILIQNLLRTKQHHPEGCMANNGGHPHFLLVSA